MRDSTVVVVGWWAQWINCLWGGVRDSKVVVVRGVVVTVDKLSGGWGGGEGGEGQHSTVGFVREKYNKCLYKRTTKWIVRDKSSTRLVHHHFW